MSMRRSSNDTVNRAFQTFLLLFSSAKRKSTAARRDPSVCAMADDAPAFVDLHAAARGGDLEALGARVAAGDDVHGMDKHKRTALHMAAWAGQVRSIVACASSSVRPPPLSHISIPRPDAMPPPLQTEAVKFLVASGAKPTSEAMDGITPLHFACQKGHLESARALIAAGANPKALTHKGENSLHMACKSGSLETVTAILRKKVDPLHRNKKGERASDVARGEQCEQIKHAVLAAAKEKTEHLAATNEGRGGGLEVDGIGPSIGPSIRPSIGPSIGPPKQTKRQIADVENAPSDALAAAGKKTKNNPVLSFGDEDE